MTPQDKKAEWKDKSKKYVTDTILKVSAIVGLILLGFAIIATPFVCPAIIPCVGAGLIIGLACGSSALAGFSILGAGFIANYSDFTDFRKPKNVEKALSRIKNADKPLSLSYFKRLNRYGIISDSELSKRKSLEPKAKEYKKLKKEILKLNGQIISKKRESKELSNLPTLKKKKDKIDNEIKALAEIIENKEKEISNIKKEFASFHKGIVDFNPNP